MPHLAAKKPPTPPSPTPAVATACDICGSAKVVERKCKVICTNCGTILQTCDDL